MGVLFAKPAVATIAPAPRVERINIKEVDVLKTTVSAYQVTATQYLHLPYVADSQEIHLHVSANEAPPAHTAFKYVFNKDPLITLDNREAGLLQATKTYAALKDRRQKLTARIQKTSRSLYDASMTEMDSMTMYAESRAGSVHGDDERNIKKWATEVRKSAAVIVRRK